MRVKKEGSQHASAGRMFTFALASKNSGGPSGSTVMVVLTPLLIFPTAVLYVMPLPVVILNGFPRPLLSENTTVRRATSTWLCDDLCGWWCAFPNILSLVSLLKVFLLFFDEEIPSLPPFGGTRDDIPQCFASAFGALIDAFGPP